MEKELRIIISGGGTGGHIFPAVSIANAIIELRPDAKILFVGAEGRMEMQRVPDAGYKIIGLPIAGFDRKHLWKNVSVLIKLARSQWKARSIIKNFRPQVAVGVGGYASGPTLKTAGMMGVPTLIQEQNSYAGVTNKLLAQKAKAICVAYDGMEKFFPADKIIMTGNPVRQNLTKDMPEKGAALRSFNLQPDKKTILIVGGSLGARTINNTLTAALATIKENNDIQFIWQTGKYYYPQVTEALRAAGELPNLYVTDFIKGYGSRLRGFRPSDFTCGSRFYFRVLSVAQACGSGSFAQCGRRSSDQECTGIGRQTSRHLCKRQRSGSKVDGCSPEHSS